MPTSFMDALVKKRRALDVQRRRAAIERERLRVREVLQEGPATTREIATRLDITTDRARLRAHEVGAVLDSALRWRLP